MMTKNTFLHLSSSEVRFYNNKSILSYTFFINGTKLNAALTKAYQVRSWPAVWRPEPATFRLKSHEADYFKTIPDGHSKIDWTRPLGYLDVIRLAQQYMEIKPSRELLKINWSQSYDIEDWSRVNYKREKWGPEKFESTTSRSIYDGDEHVIIARQLSHRF